MNSNLKAFSDSPFLTSLLILVATVFAGRIINLLFERVLLRIVGKTKTKLDDKIMSKLRMPVFWSVVLIGIFIASSSLQISQKAINPFSKILISLGLIIWGITSIEISRLLFHKLEEKAQAEHKTSLEDFLPFLDNMAIIVVGVVILLTALSLWGINITPALASAGVAGIAIAFASKDTIANIFGGISVFLDRPYKSGDYVIINDQYRGEVIQIGIRSTKIRTRDNVLLTVPNAVMATDAIINETGFEPQLRIRIPLSIAYGTDLDKAEKILIDVVLKHQAMLKKPKPRVRFRRFGESAIELEVMGVIARPADRGRITHELIKSIDKTLRKEKIISPFPQRDVHLYKEN